MSTPFTYNPYYQARIIETVDKALLRHPRTTAIRLDLRIPDDYWSAFPSSLITRFFESLKAKVAVDLRRKERSWQKKLACKVSYVWVRELGPVNGKLHFHVLLLLNKDVYLTLGDFKRESGTLAALIQEAWCSALSLPYHQHRRSVHFCKGGVVHMNSNHSDFMRQWQLVMEKANYLAKEATKHYGDGLRSFGCSR